MAFTTGQRSHDIKKRKEKKKKKKKKKKREKKSRKKKKKPHRQKRAENKTNRRAIPGREGEACGVRIGCGQDSDRDEATLTQAGHPGQAFEVLSLPCPTYTSRYQRRPEDTVMFVRGCGRPTVTMNTAHTPGWALLTRVQAWKRLVYRHIFMHGSTCTFVET